MHPLVDPSSWYELKVHMEDAACILKPIREMFISWPTLNNEGGVSQKIKRRAKPAPVVHDWQQAEQVPWLCATCFAFSHSDAAVQKGFNESCTPFIG